jgi:tetratricopeptide (TPR) repeat protein
LATLALQKNDMDLLDQSASAWLHFAPSAPHGYMMRGTLRIKRGDLAGAEADLHTTIEMDPKNAMAHSRLGDIRAYQKRFAEAEKLYEQALEFNPRAAETLQELTNLLIFEKQPEKAMQRVRLQVSRVPDNANYHFLLGQLLLANHQAAEAEVESEKAVVLDKSNSGAMLLRARALQEVGRLDEAEAAFEHLMQANPKNPEPCVAFGLLEERQGNWQRAEQLYRRALDLQASQPAAANNLSYLLLEHGGDTNYAFSLAQIARRGMPDSPSTADTLAWAYYKKGLYDSAIDLFQEAVKGVPQNATYHYHLALAYQRSNRAILAKASFQRALDLDPKSSRALEIRQAMSGLSTNQ